jgi:hypothetical protein
LIQKETDSLWLVTLGGHRIKSMYFPTPAAPRDRQRLVY